MSFGGGSSGGTTTQQETPYAQAEPALAQLLSELNYRKLQYETNKYKYMLIDIRKENKWI